MCWQKGLRNPSQREMAKQSAIRVTHMREMRSGWLLHDAQGWTKPSRAFWLEKCPAPHFALL